LRSPYAIAKALRACFQPGGECREADGLLVRLAEDGLVLADLALRRGLRGGQRVGGLVDQVAEKDVRGELRDWRRASGRRAVRVQVPADLGLGEVAELA
jgi:hypothetical protein